MIEDRFIERIAKEVGVGKERVAAAIALFDKGATVPFVARYRKDASQQLGESDLERIADRNAYFSALSNRRDAVLANVSALEKLSEPLKAQLDAVVDQEILEDLYLPFKKQRRTKACAAREQGLEPLADAIWAPPAEGDTLPHEADKFVNPALGVHDADHALMGAQHILAERVSCDAFARNLIRMTLRKEGVFVVRATKNLGEDARRFEAFAHFTEPLSKVSPTQLLTVVRGVRMGLLRSELTVDDQACIQKIAAHFGAQPGAPTEEVIRVIVEDAFRRLLRPELENEVLNEARSRAEDEIFSQAREALRQALSAPPLGAVPVIGFDPDGQGGGRGALVDAAGAVVRTVEIASPASTTEAVFAEALLELLHAHSPRAIAIGNGAGSRELGAHIRRVLIAQGRKREEVVYLQEAPASAYANAKIAQDELPELEAHHRRAVSLARRLQDPLTELLKLEPKNIFLGQFHFDLNQRRFRDALQRTMESCVNRVGADVNHATVEMLQYISALQAGTAENIVAHRAANGPFLNRLQLLGVPGIGEKTYEQCVGFLRIHGGDQPLDATGIHPESYPAVTRLAQHLGAAEAELHGNRSLLEHANLAPCADEITGPQALEDIRWELIRRGRDARHAFAFPRFRSDITQSSQLQEGMELEGVVTNVTHFGAFMDLGLEQDGLIHLSELSHRFVKDPHRILRIGDILRVKVIKIDAATGHISLSRKAVVTERKPGDAPGHDRRPGRPRPGQEARPPRSDRPARPPRPAAAGETAPAVPRERPAAPQGDTRDRRPPRSHQPDGDAARRAPANRDRDRERPVRDARPRSSEHAPKPAAPRSAASGSAPQGEGMNTTLADQLAALKDSLK